ncbi:alpha/beta hydrolase [Xanthobacter sp. KR7-225]|uniref:alpha/beta hydrolase n=1 Tax=Xanthobacter sp. KR7-225 TaxID=3156613 RepID=UPI0032B39624
MEIEAVDYETQINIALRIPDRETVIEGWHRDAEAYRQEARAELGIPYGPGARQYVDVFHGDGGGGSLAPVVLIHGGYWQRYDCRAFSHLASGLNRHGVDVMMPNYTLAPEVRIEDIYREMCTVMVRAYERWRRPVVIAGHSAGGNFAARMLAEDWTRHGLPGDFVRSAFSISGIYDLRPVIGTTINGALKLDEARAVALSPLLQPAPDSGILDVLVGALESEVYLAQADEIVRAWGKSGVQASGAQVAGANHLTVLAQLTDPESPGLRTLVARAGG